MNAPSDAQQRAAALDISQSFIVQAPAGSGKTELLTQRFLKLLARVDRPERLLAITFTRKATQEMRERILRRLRQAASQQEPASEHERMAIDLAREALQRDEQAGWKLLQNPGRLRVLTIDGLCAQFLARDPKLGGLGAGLAVQELAEPLYREAIERLFEELARVPADEQAAVDTWSEARQALSRVLYLLDGDAQQLRKLLIDKLQARDQWVDRIGMDADSLAAVIAGRQEVELRNFYQALGWDKYQKASKLTAELGAAVASNYPPSLFAALYQPGTSDLQLQVHQAWLFSRMMLKSDHKLMKPGSLNRRIFKDLPTTFNETLKILQGQLAEWSEDAAATAAIERMGKAPPLELGQGTEALHQDIVLVLMYALARLRVLFHDKGECDFHYMTELALESLGEEDNPGSLLLAEDARIEHILMDEFQDTSNTQFKLLRRLMSGWTGDDGRSLFLVGDPMQSIYRFRQANVGLFIDVVQQGGLGTVPLEYLQLQSNFRSRQEIVNWVNKQFSGVFPARDERDSGAVRYAPAAAEQGSGGAVRLYPLPPETADEEEALRVVDLVRQARAELGDPSIAILGRARKHLEQIARALQQASIEAQAVKIDPLQERPVVRDLMALTRALSHPGDRIAWLAIMRAPWAGLSVAELHAVAGELLKRDLLSCLQEAAEKPATSELHARLNRLAIVMTQAEAHRAQRSLRERVEQAWLSLGGPLCYASADELEHARTFLDLLQELEQQGTEDLETRLGRHLQELYAISSASRLQLMTIHQAKGLEFDVVIVPGMARRPRGDDKTLVALQEFHNEDGGDSSLLAPLPARIKPEASLYEYLRAVEIERSAFEQQRLLYVACTRASHQLHLLGKYSNSKSKGIYAASGSLMELLFPAFEAVIDLQTDEPGESDASDASDDNDVNEDAFVEPKAYPLLQLQGAPLLALPEIIEQPEEICQLPEMSTRKSVALGGAVHDWLELIHDHWQQGWDADWFEQNSAALESSLRRAGFSAAEAAVQLPDLKHMLIQSISSEPGRAVISPEGKQQSWTELPLLHREGNRISKHIIDRLYQAENGELVIVDYKTGTESLEAREHWASQLQRYKDLLQRLDSVSVSSTLIFQVSDNQLIDLSNETGCLDRP